MGIRCKLSDSIDLISSFENSISSELRSALEILNDDQTSASEKLELVEDSIRNVLIDLNEL